MTSDLKPLLKPHYTWPSTDIADDAKWNEFTRMAGTVSVHVDHFRAKQFAAARALAERHNAKVGVLIDAWSRGDGFDPLAPPTRMSGNTLNGAQYMANVLGHAAEETADLPVACVQIVYERHHVRPDNAAWNDAIDERARIVWELCGEAFPSVRREMYNYGHREPNTSGPGGWTPNQYLPDWLTWLNQFDRSCSLYEPAELDRTRAKFRRICDDFPGVPVTPHLSLGWSHSRKAEGGCYSYVPGWLAEDGHDYPLVNSWCLGAEMNEPWYSAPERRHLYPDWSRAETVWLWPAAFERAAFQDHWRAYCRGANGVETT